MIQELLDAVAMDHDQELNNLGHKIGRIFTDHGLPLDMAMDRLPQLDRLQKLAVLNGACEEILEHKKRSGATPKAIERTQQSNRDMITRFIKTGETGAY